MRKKSLLIALLSILSMFFLVSCKAPSKIDASFLQESYALSIDEEFDFSQELTLTGAEIEQIEFSSSDESILFPSENGFIAKQSGRCIVNAKLGENVLTSARVIVKHVFSLPDTYSLTDEGLLSWNASFALIDGKKIYARAYQVIVDGESTIVDSPEFLLSKKGNFQVTIIPLSYNDEFIDRPKTGKTFFVNYGVMEKVEGFSVTPHEIAGVESAYISWTNLRDAKYDVIVDGITLLENYSQNSFTLNYYNYIGGQHLNLKIIAYDIYNNKMPSVSEVKLYKLYTPEIAYSYSSDSGVITWNELPNATGYNLTYTSKTGNVSGFLTDENFKKDNGTVTCNLPALNNDIYSISIQAVGGEKNGKLYLSSSFSEELTVAKLNQAQIQITIDGKNIIANASPNDYVENYRIECGNFSTVWKAREDFVISSTLFSTGKYKIKITALPTYENDKVKNYIIGEQGTSNVIDSDPVFHDIFILEDIGDITHEIVGTDSMISFSQIADVDNYTLSLNGNKLDLDFSVENGKVKFVLANLSTYQPLNNKYEFSVVASRKDGKAVSTEKIKTINILPTVTKNANQTNGYFIWNNIENAKFTYKVYNSNSSGQKLELIAEETIEGNSTLNPLGFGYYLIEIITKSMNTDSFLDSNFYDNTGFSEFIFHVEEKIAKPEVKFISGEKYSLEIKYSQFAGKYEIYVNDTKDGDLITDGSKEKLNYNFLNENFNEAKLYTVKIIAKAGSVSDEIIHTNSEESILTVDKLSVATYTIDSEFDSQGKKVKEDLVLDLDEKALSYEVYKEGVKISGNVIDLKNYSGNFDLTLKKIAKASVGNHYYLDSNPISYSFHRLENPTNLAYLSGNVSFESLDHLNAEKYLYTLRLVNETNGDFVQLVEGTEANFNLQQYIDSKQGGEVFDAAYLQCSRIEVEVKAFSYKFEEKQYLPSNEASTILGHTVLTIEELKAAHPTFNNQTLEMSWEGVGDERLSNTFYDIYADNTLYKTLESVNKIVLTDLNFLETKTVYLIARNSSYLSSKKSYNLIIRQLKKIDSVNIALNSGKWKLSFAISGQDQNYVEKVLINGSANNVEYIRGASTAGIILDEYITQNNNYAIKLEVASSPMLLSGDESNKYYYISSQTVNYVMEDLSLNTIETRTIDNKLTWLDVAQDFKGIDLRPMSYTVSVYRGGEQVKVISGLKVTEIAIDTLQEGILGGMQSGEYSVVVTTVLENYSLTLSNGEAKGYYKTGTSNNVAIVKLDKVQTINLELIEDASVTDKITSKIDSLVKLSWENLWGEVTSVSFDVELNNGEFTKNLNLIKNGDVGDGFSLSTINGSYNLILDSNLFKEGNTTISIKVKNDISITSDMYQRQVNRLQGVEQISITPEALLQIRPNLTDATENLVYFISLEAGGKVEYFTSEISELNLFEKMKAVFGNYKIRLIAIDKNNARLPSIDIKEITGERLAGISNVQVQSDGSVQITLNNTPENNLVFNARLMDSFGGEVLLSRSFTPSLTEGINVYEYSLQDFINLFTMSEGYPEGLNFTAGPVYLNLSTKKEGSVESDFYPFTFNYNIETAQGENKGISLKRGKNMADDYIFVDAQSVAGTVAFDLRIEYYVVKTVDSLQVAELTEERNNLIAADYYGYWLTPVSPASEEEKRGYFSKGETSGFVAQPGYAIKLSSLLQNVKYGQVKITISRLTVNEGIYTQFNTKSLNCNKLFTPSNVRLKETKVVWSTNIGKVPNEIVYVKPSGYYVEFYTMSEGNEVLVDYQYTTSESFDVKDFLVNNRNYNVKVRAVSIDHSVISSELSSKQNLYKFSPPTSLQIEGGKIIFDKEKVRESDFVKTFKNYYDSAEFFRQFSNAIYVDIFGFDLSTVNLSDIKIKLKFTNANREGYATVNALDLMPDLSYISITTNSGVMTLSEAMRNKYNDSLGAVEENRATYSKFYNKLISANKGVADANIIFDSFGKDVIADEYSISAMQAGDSTRGNIESEPSLTILANVTQAPNVTLSSVANAETYKENFFITFKPVNITTLENGIKTAIPANKYYMKWSGTTNYLFEINQVQGEFSISAIKGVNSSPDLSSILTKEENGSVRIDVSKLMKICELSRETYTVDIFAAGNDYSISSKSQTLSITLLEFSGDDTNTISFNNGVISWSSKNSDAPTKLVIKAQGNDAITKTIFPDHNEMVLRLESDGFYEFVTFSMQGSIGVNQMSVESESYIIQNLYKLHSPIMTVKDNLINLSPQTNDGINDLAYQNQYTYTISNNNSLDKDTDSQFFISDKMKDNSIYSYKPGIQLTKEGDKYYNYKTTENAATEFYAKVTGGTGSFNIQSVVDGSADYSLSILNTRYVVLSSENALVNASMLASPTNLRIENGNFVWDKSTQGKEISSEFKSYFKINVDYYNGSIDANNYIKTDVFFTSATTLDSNLLDGRIVENCIFVIGVQEVAFRESDANDYDEVSVEGNYLKIDSVTYTDGMFALASDYIFSRESTKIASPTDFKVEGGSISFTDTAYIDSTYQIFADYYDENRALKTKELGFTREVDQSNNLVNVSINEGMFDGINPYTLRLYKWNSEQLKSDVISLPYVYKLKPVEFSEIEFTGSGNSYTLSLAKYFENNKINYDNSCYKVELTISLTSQDCPLIELTSTTKIAVISLVEDEAITVEGNTIKIPTKLRSEIKTFTFKVMDNQQDNTVGKKRLINSDVASFSLPSYSFGNADSVVWDEQLNRFIWTYGLNSLTNVETNLYYFSNGNRIESTLLEIDTVINLNGEKYVWEGSEYLGVNYSENDTQEYFILSSCVKKGYKFYYATNKEAELFNWEGENMVSTSTRLIKGATVYPTGETKTVNGIEYSAVQQGADKKYLLSEDITLKQIPNLTDNPQFQVIMEYSNKVKETKSTDALSSFVKEGVTYYYLQPQTLGEITKVSVMVRDRQSLSFYSQEIMLTGNFNNNLFASGIGTESSPYGISSLSHFTNISKRNNQGVYFKLLNDLTLESGLQIDSFKGNFDGGGHSMTYKVNNFYEINSTQTVLNGTNTTRSISLTSGAGIFKEIAKGALVTNLTLNLDIESSLNATTVGEGVLIAPLAVYNKGNISNVQTGNFALNSSITNLPVVIGGIVGFNYGSINDCKNSSIISLAIPSSANSINFFYGGIAAFNLNLGTTHGSITRAVNEGNKTFTIVKANSTVQLAGIAISSSGKITQSGNKANLEVNGLGFTNFTSFVSGIALRVLNSYLTYNYNNRNFISNASKFYSAGIALNVSGGTLGGLIECTGLAVVNQASNVKISSPCYAKGVVQAITTYSISAMTISCGDGKNLIVEENNGIFTAKIE